MSELNDVIGGNTITASFTNEVKERSLMRYATAAARDSSIPAPIAGSQAWIEDSDKVTIYDGAVWFDARYDDAEAVAAIPHRIILSQRFTSAQVADGVVLDTFTLPNESGSARIVVSGPCGFSGSDIEVRMDLSGSGLTNPLTDRVFAPASQFTVAMGWAVATLSGQTISVVASSNAGNAFYRGVIEVVKL